MKSVIWLKLFVFDLKLAKYYLTDIKYHKNQNLKFQSNEIEDAGFINSAQ